MVNDTINDIDKKRCIKRLYSLKKSEAKKRNKTFNLTLSTFGLLIQGKCFYCGAESSNLLTYRGIEFQYNGIDRMDTKGGYEIENSVPCCKFCNALRGSMPFEYWSEFIDNVVENGISPFRFGKDQERFYDTVRGASGYEKVAYYKR